jgi:hypothetical protein
MIKKYQIKHTDLVKLLNKIQEFQNTFENWVMKHNNYTYKTNIEQNKDLWVCNIEVRHEQTKDKVSKETIKPLGVL